MFTAFHPFQDTDLEILKFVSDKMENQSVIMLYATNNLTQSQMASQSTFYAHVHCMVHGSVWINLTQGSRTHTYNLGNYEYLDTPVSMISGSKATVHTLYYLAFTYTYYMMITQYTPCYLHYTASVNYIAVFVVFPKWYIFEIRNYFLCTKYFLYVVQGLNVLLGSIEATYIVPYISKRSSL